MKREYLLHLVLWIGLILFTLAGGTYLLLQGLDGVLNGHMIGNSAGRAPRGYIFGRDARIQGVLSIILGLVTVGSSMWMARYLMRNRAHSKPDSS